MLIVISPSEANDECEYLDSLLEQGMDFFHIRKPTWAKDQVENYLKNLSPAVRSVSVLHQHHELTREYGLFGSHLKERERAQLNEYPKDTKSTSVHSLKVISGLDSNRFKYVFFSPVFKSISKPDYEPSYSDQELQAALCGSKIELCALGGISSANIDQLKPIGFKSAAVCGALWESKDPVFEFKKLSEAWKCSVQ